MTRVIAIANVSPWPPNRTWKSPLSVVEYSPKREARGSGFRLLNIRQNQQSNDTKRLFQAKQAVLPNFGMPKIGVTYRKITIHLLIIEICAASFRAEIEYQPKREETSWWRLRSLLHKKPASGSDSVTPVLARAEFMVTQADEDQDLYRYA